MSRRYAVFTVAVLGTLTGAALVSAQLPPDKAVESLKAADGLQVELFAAEPMVINPTSMDVDHKGRVWVAEAVNYRRKMRNQPLLRDEGDRIVVLTDTNEDGKADEATTFYQSQELYGPLSVCVIPQADGKGLRVLVAQSPDILEFWDQDGDLKADGPPTKFLTGFKGFDHDHGVHGLSSRPGRQALFHRRRPGRRRAAIEGRQGAEVHVEQHRLAGRDRLAVRSGRDEHRADRPQLPQQLRGVRRQFRRDLVLGQRRRRQPADPHLFRHARRQLRLLPPRQRREPLARGTAGDRPQDAPHRLRQPDGHLLLRGRVAAREVPRPTAAHRRRPAGVASFHITPKGAGYELEKENLLTSSDNWFRPSDVCVAPDGSVFVCDWYDPGVGGHGMGDWTRGRVYRITPKGHTGYKVPAVKLETKEGLANALGSPCLSARSAAISALNAMPAADAAECVVVAEVSRPDLARASRLATGSRVTESASR